MKSLVAVLCGVLLLAGGARADTPETQSENLERFTPYLQRPVEQFKFWSMYKWQLVGPDKVVVWTTIDDAYLLTVETPCTQLQWSRDIGVTSQASHTVMRRMDAVVAGNDRCRILEIRPVDYRLMQSESRGKPVR
ncbi:DUF6491 family protein [Dokdonella sp.]|uniref:DUF6491 family protein n=1 Tax=Dokdonella sp. TaxID=2291710 RepID=UPI001B1B9EAD|nr:DUF6491 family protein [Dokdonella sp.]MBO9664940.1 hypothetical protein [Dokdonella sp.]